MAIALTCEIGASGSWRLGGTMVMVFYVLGCVVCVVVKRRLVSWGTLLDEHDVRDKYFYHAIFFLSIMLEWY
jgi:hypothetical protein